MKSPHEIISAHCRAIGRLGGSRKSERKAAAVRQNGRKGGWTKGRPRKVKTAESEAAQ